MSSGRYQKAEIESLTQAALKDGFCILPDHFSKEKLGVWREAFAPLLDDDCDTEIYQSFAY